MVGGLEARLELSPGIGKNDAILETSAYLTQRLTALRDTIGSSEYTPTQVSTELVDVYRDAARKVFSYCLASVSSDCKEGHFNGALVFIGGYARGDPSFGSDLDLRFLHREPEEKLDKYTLNVIKLFNEVISEIYSRTAKKVFKGKGHDFIVIANSFDLAELTEPQQKRSYLVTRFIAGEEDVATAFSDNFISSRDKITMVKEIFERYDRVKPVADDVPIDLKDSIGGLVITI